jgi:hypothetical protein
MLNDFNGHKLGFSPDGLVGNTGLLEIKSRKPRVQLATILADRVPRENMAQLQTGLLVSGRRWIDYLSYSGGLPLYVKRVYRDDAWQTVIRDALDMFETNAARMIERYKNTVGDAPIAPRIDHFQGIELKL